MEGPFLEHGVFLNRKLEFSMKVERWYDIDDKQKWKERLLEFCGDCRDSRNAMQFVAHEEFDRMRGAGFLREELDDEYYRDAIDPKQVAGYLCCYLKACNDIGDYFRAIKERISMAILTVETENWKDSG